MVISKTPLRCSFFGGGTDFSAYYENTKLGYGATISTALDMFVYITVNHNFDGKIRLCYSGNELVNHVDEVKHNIIREALKLTGIDGGIEIIYSADIPLSGAGIGLASSSALAVGVLNALYSFKGQYVPPDELAKQACIIEIEKLGQKIGIQDQYAVSYGGFNRYRYNNNGSVDVIPVICDNAIKLKLQENFLLFYTGLTRDSNNILNEQVNNINDNTLILDDLVETVNTAYLDLVNGNIDNWGLLLDKTWKLKKQFSVGVSNNLIDGMYNKAKNAGALGGKILGAGGGGFMLLYVPIEKQVFVKNALSEYRQVNFKFEPHGTSIIFYNKGKQ